MIELSILICSLIERRNEFLDNLLTILNSQIKDKAVELLILSDNVKRTVGEKRNDLIDLSKGKYFCFIDDDDRVVNDYVDLILAEMSNEPDVIVFNAEITFDGQRPKLVRYGMEYDHCETEDAYYRRPNHLMVHKRALVNERFKEISFGEDDEWAARHLPNIKTQAKIDKILYYYDYKTTIKKYT